MKNVLPHFGSLVRTICTLTRDRRGGVAVIFAITLVPLMMTIGAALDYARLSKTKAELNAVADSAALAGVSQSMMASTPETAQAAVIKAFRTQQAAQQGASLTNVTATVTDSTDNVRTVAVNYTAQMKTTILAAVGMTTFQVNGSATTRSSRPTYIDFYLLLDNTPSMGIGATPADIAKLVDATATAKSFSSCAFACHITGSTSDRYTLAKSLGINMRIDVLRLAAQRLMDTAAAVQKLPEQFRMAIYSYGTACDASKPATITSLTSSLSGAKTAAGAIDLMVIPYQGYRNDQCTSNNSNLTAMNAVIDKPGSGATAATPQKVLFLVTDGVTNENNLLSCTNVTLATIAYGSCIEPLNPAYCETIKARGIKVAVLYTTYYPLPKDAWYNSYVAPFQPRIDERTKACASPGLFFEVSMDQGISDAMNALFLKIVENARLTN